MPMLHNEGVANPANLRKEECAFQKYYKILKPDEFYSLINTIKSIFIKYLLCAKHHTKLFKISSQLIFKIIFEE